MTVAFLAASAWHQRQSSTFCVHRVFKRISEAITFPVIAEFCNVFCVSVVQTSDSVMEPSPGDVNMDYSYLTGSYLEFRRILLLFVFISDIFSQSYRHNYD